MASYRWILAWVLLCCVGAGACAGGPSRDQVLRAEREYDLARGLYGERDFAGAFEHLLEAIELDPHNAEAHLLLANLFFLQRADYERAEHHFEEALRAHERAQQRAGLPSDVRNSQGVMYIHMERYEDAEALLREASSDLMNRDPGLAKTNLAWVYILREEYEPAIEVLLSAVQQNPQLCIAWYRLGQARSALEDLDRADDALTRGLEVDDATCQQLQAAWRLRGEVRALQGHRQEAISDLERCVELSAETEDGQACQRLIQSTFPDQGQSGGGSEGTEEAPAPSPEPPPEDPPEASQ